MHFAQLIPFWNSLDSVRRVHSDLEFAALVFFALLVLFDVLAHLSEDKPRVRLLEKIGLAFFAVAVFAELLAYPYGQRNDNLSAEKIKSLDLEAGDALNKANAARIVAQSASDIAKPAKETADAAKGEADDASREADNLSRHLTATGKQLNAVDEKRARLVEELSWRDLTEKQSDALTTVLQSSPGSRIIIGMTSPDSAEKRQYAWAMLSAFLAAKWSFVGFRQGGLEFDGRIPIGISIWCGRQPCSSSSATLHNALCAAGITSTSVSLPAFGPDVILVIGDARPPKWQDLEHLSLECKTPWPVPKTHP
jgi:hypothetical protein